LNDTVRTTNDPIEAARALAAGQLVALPTETVYGLGVLASDPNAVAAVFAAKGRPADHPLIVHVSDVEAVRAWSADLPRYAAVLADRFWPGPLTLVLPRSTRALDAVTGGQETVALRISAHPDFRAVLDALASQLRDPSVGIAAPSANRFGRVSPTSPAHVHDEFDDLLGDEHLIFEGGSSSVGLESTIVDCTQDEPAILRPGAITAEDITAATGLPVRAASQVRAPGTLDSHYAPNARVLLVDESNVPDATHAQAGFLALKEIPTPQGAVRLAEPSDADEYARILYAALRQADALGLAHVIAVPPTDSGIGAAVADRLKRAAH
jgi:L-threonylcarbamoyladenylate synthase